MPAGLSIAPWPAAGQDFSTRFGALDGACNLPSSTVLCCCLFFQLFRGHGRPDGVRCCMHANSPRGAADQTTVRHCGHLCACCRVVRWPCRSWHRTSCPTRSHGWVAPSSRCLPRCRGKNGRRTPSFLSWRIHLWPEIGCRNACGIYLARAHNAIDGNITKRTRVVECCVLVPFGAAVKVRLFSGVHRRRYARSSFAALTRVLARLVRQPHPRRVIVLRVLFTTKEGWPKATLIAWPCRISGLMGLLWPGCCFITVKVSAA